MKLYAKNINTVTLSGLEDLPPYRAEKVNRLVHKEDKLRSIAAGLLLRERLPDGEISLGEFGKPFSKSGIPFNLAHSGEWAILCVGGRHAVGCDIERLRELNFERLGKTVFHENELAALNKAENKRDCFFTLWTKKESFIKCIGEGFRLPVASLDLSGSEYEYEGGLYFFKEYMLGEYKIMLCSEDRDFPDEILS